MSKIARWFIQLEKDIDELANKFDYDEQRLILLQHALIDLIDFLDKDYIYFSPEYRQKI
ncbi:hypothetical protein ACF3DV_11485 [Chlorogloeopsis fritschii PCC 9212]|uniref:hypothetical protein n=1 Tax=Chlorogloeopsis fritschii TaxID=1124 RepID=UPI0002D59995|nr:hypothetical protein [Chlorogloeopsis fritschii]